MANLSPLDEAKRPHLIVPPALSDRGASEIETDGRLNQQDTERDCGKCIQQGDTSVMVVNSRDVASPACPKLWTTDSTAIQAVKNNNIELLKYYASIDRDSLEKKDCYGQTPFHHACWRGFSEIIVFLMRVLSSCSILVCDNQNWSPLHFICDSKNPQLSIVKDFVERFDMDPRQEADDRSTPVSLAILKGHKSIIHYLTDCMLDMKPTEPKYQQPQLKIRNQSETFASMSTSSDHPGAERNMGRLENRLYSFTMASGSWPRAHPNERVLAEQGFVYTGVEERVFCFCCKAVVQFWGDKVDPLLKHYDVSPQCQFLLQNFRPQLERLQAQRRVVHFNSKYEGHSVRLQSFDTWRFSSVVSYFRLASAGFYYTGVGLQTICFSCGLMHSQWKRGDLPIEVHKRRNPNCEYLKSIEAPTQTTTHEAGLQPSSLPSSLPTFAKPLPSTKLPQPTRREESSARVTAKQPNYESLENRIKSFKRLPKDFVVSAEDCAKVGLFLLRKPDVMQCFKCDAIVRNWIIGDVPSEKHREISPHCKFLLDNFPTKLQEEVASSVDPKSLPEPMFTREDLEQMSEEKALPAISSLKIQSKPKQSPLGPIEPSPEDSGYSSQPPSSLEYRMASLASQNTSLNYISLEPPVRSKTQVSPSLKLTECVVCMDNGLEVVLLPCGHLCVCQSCAVNIDQCPMCRQRVTNTVRAYLP